MMIDWKTIKNTGQIWVYGSPNHSPDFGAMSEKVEEREGAFTLAQKVEGWEAGGVGVKWSEMEWWSGGVME